jgi:hypothetical protein
MNTVKIIAPKPHQQDFFLQIMKIGYEYIASDESTTLKNFF